jgi:hypothetical protein
MFTGATLGYDRTVNEGRGHMTKQLRRICTSAAVSAVLSLGFAGSAVAAPVVTGGLVNVTVTDVLNNNQVNAQVPIGVAANVCGLSVAAVAAAAATGPVDCTSSTTQDLPVRFRP